MFRELRRRGHQLEAERWDKCEAMLSKRACTDPAHHVTLTPTRCELRICPTCARRAAAKQVATFCEGLEALNRAGAFNRGRATNRPSFKMLTLTLKQRKSLRQGVGEIMRCWRELSRRVGFERDKRDKLFGALAAVEIGPHRNVHLHVTYWGKYVPQDLLTSLWKEISGDSYIVHIKELRGSWRDAARETCKYVTKLATTDAAGRSSDQEAGLPEVFLVDVLEAFKKRRRIATYGVFYNVQTKAAERGDQVCGVCGKPLTYVGTFGPEWLPVWELADYLTARRSRTATGAAA